MENVCHNCMATANRAVVVFVKEFVLLEGEEIIEGLG